MMKTWIRKSAAAWVAAVCVGAATPARAAGTGVARQFSNDIADTVQKVMPSVVVIRTEATRYRRAYDLMYGRRLMIPEVMAGQGSGVFIDRHGHVLTSAHVVQGAQEIGVALSDGEEFDAKLVGIDKITDLAVLKVEGKLPSDLEPITMGDSDRLRIGEFVIAAGSPFSLSSSVTLGIVSQKGRSVGLLPYEDFIQTDAPINPGNSGGPLVDVDGRLVGINAVIQTSGPYSQGNIGIGFAVPVNLARRVADSIIKHGYFARPWIGIRPRERLARNGDNAPATLVVDEVYARTPAAREGVQAGDVLSELDGRPLTSVRDLQKAILETDVGTPLHLVLLRDGKRMKVDLITVAMPDYGNRER